MRRYLALGRPLSLVALLAALASACAGSSGADYGAPSAGADAGAGGVSFGGQQDIGELRGILENGGIPGPDTLDANGFFNEHYAPPPATDCTDPLCLTPGVAVGKDWLTGAHQATLQIAVQTNVDPTTLTRKPLDLVVVVDHSGSMWDDQRLEKVKTGLHTLIDGLQDTDRLALVEFDDRVDIDMPFGETLDRGALHAIVDGLTPRGSTNIYGGLQAGFELARATLSSDRQHRVIFLSDGMATAGITDDAAIIQMADGYVETGIGLTTIGVGQSFDVQLMRGLAEHGAGNFYFLEDAAAATEVFTQELDYFVTPLALDIQIDATAGTGFDFGEVVGSTLWQATTRTGTMHIPAAFVASRISQAPDPTTGGRRGGGSMLFIHLAPTGHNTDGKVADLTLRYRLPGATTYTTQTVSLVYPNDPSETPPDPYLSNPEMAERYAMYNVFLGLRYATRASDYTCAAVALQATRTSAAAWNATHEDPDITADLALIDRYLTNLATWGANLDSGTTLDSCQGAADPYGEVPPYDDRGPDVQYACSASGGRGGHGASLVIALAVLVVVRRRRSATM